MAGVSGECGASVAVPGGNEKHTGIERVTANAFEIQNRHRLIATEVVARLLWCFFGGKSPLKTAA
jgi:hypothetical protein